MSTSNVPRRARVDQMSPGELAIRNAMGEVESMGADPRLTKAVVALTEAQEQVADFVDGVEHEEASPWKTWETAPKDGTPILVCNMEYECEEDISGLGPHPRTVSWRYFHPNATGKATWRDRMGHKDEYWTHWMPLPASPRDKEIP